MSRTHDLHRPSWWGPNWLGFPVAFWLSVLASATTTGVLAWVLLRLLAPSLFTPLADSPPNPEPRVLAEYYAAFAAALGALPPLHAWRRALRRRGLHSWDD